MYTSQHTRLGSAPPYSNEYKLAVLKYRKLIIINYSIIILNTNNNICTLYKIKACLVNNIYIYSAT